MAVALIVTSATKFVDAVNVQLAGSNSPVLFATFSTGITTWLSHPLPITIQS
tara:strand:- start:127 stop:282 length:156 start_codon:yes stop_codon:yes gene_type:complete